MCLLEGSGVALVATSIKCIDLCILKKCISINSVSYTMCVFFVLLLFLLKLCKYCHAFASL